MFTEMGWLNNDLSTNDDMIFADIVTLPMEMSDALNGEEFDTCVDTVEDKIKEAMIKGFGKCVSKGKYSDDEQTAILALLNGVAKVECFKYIFEESCGLYMSNTLEQMAGGNSGSGSGSDSGI